MKKSLATIIFGIAIVTIAIAIALISLSQPDVVITAEDLDQACATNDGIIQRQIVIDGDESFKLSLHAHWSAGMRWSVEYSVQGIVRQDGSREYKSDNAPLTLGFGGCGHEEWIFKALTEGKTTIIMSYGSVANLPDARQDVNTLQLVVEVK